MLENFQTRFSYSRIAFQTGKIQAVNDSAIILFIFYFITQDKIKKPRKCEAQKLKLLWLLVSLPMS